MASKDTIAKAFVLLSGNWPNHPSTETTMATYQRLLADIPDDVAEAAVLDCIASCKFFPTVAEIRESAANIVTDAANVILRVNKAFTEITGYSAEEAVGNTPRLLNSGRHNKAFYTAMWKRITRSGSWRGEIWNRRKNGEIYPIYLSITAVKGDDGAVSHYVGTFTDTTERKAAAEKIEFLAFTINLTGIEEKPHTEALFHARHNPQQFRRTG